MTAARSDFLVEDHGPLSRSTALPIDAPAPGDAWNDYPWAERDPSVTEQQRQTRTWIEEILADIDQPR